VNRKLWNAAVSLVTDWLLCNLLMRNSQFWQEATALVA
jgi:hypothetical protein